MPDPRANRLIQETSPYLRQHAHNPVDWYPWGKEALDRSRDEDRPIFLSIGYSACHWCHVMERESFENEEIARIMNQRFVNVKVDREERPDLDDIYMSAVQAMTGSGGWPMSVFLTPKLEPFYGGTYFPPDDRYGRPGFARILVAVSEFYSTKGEEARAQAQKVLSYLIQSSAIRSNGPDLSDEILESAFGRLSENFDHTNGGFGAAPKFPGAMSLAFFLRYCHRFGSPRALEMVIHACRKMAQGGIYDQVGGGFHRYSVDERWLVPHFEKMLYDNSLLALLYTEAYQATGEPLFRRVVEETLQYVAREMTDPAGGFYSTQDADSEGEEGKFFVWTPEEVDQVLGDEEGVPFCRYFDITPHGNFEHGKSILNTPEPEDAIARLLKLDVKRLKDILHGGREKLFMAREQRVKPGRDEKVLTSWNGLMISAFARASSLLENSKYQIVAERSARFIWNNMWDGSRLLHVWKDGQARLNGYLDDYAFYLCGLIDLYEADFGVTWIQHALALAEVMRSRFWDDRDGGFYYTSSDHEDLVSRSKNPYDNAIPSGNSAAAFGLLRLGALTGRKDVRETGEAVLKTFRDAMSEVPGGFSHMLCAADFFLKPPVEIAVIGRREAPDTQRLLREVHGRFLPGKVVALLDPVRTIPDATEIIPLLADKTQKDGVATAYVCRDFACSAPVTDPGDLAALLQD